MILLKLMLAFFMCFVSACAWFLMLFSSLLYLKSAWKCVIFLDNCRMPWENP